MKGDRRKGAGVPRTAGEKADEHSTLPDPADDPAGTLVGSEPATLPADGNIARLGPGSTLAEFKVIRKLGSGGMGVVYLAEDQVLGGVVALKVLPGRETEIAFRERFMSEGRLLAALDRHHPNIIPIRRFGEQSGWLYIAMRYVEGSDLGERLKESGPLTPEEAQRVLQPVAEALDAAHRYGLIHRDVKPANILLSNEGHVYLSDFGLAKSSVAADPAFTRTGVFVGTPAYVAPEQIEGGKVDERTDVYGLGCVLFACLTGEQPFAGNDVRVLFSHLHETPPRVSERRPGLPADVDDVIAKALAKNPDDRFATCSQLLTAFAAALTEPDRETAVPPPARRRPQLGLAAAGAFGIVAVIAAVLLAPSVFAFIGNLMAAGPPATPSPNPSANSATPPSPGSSPIQFATPGDTLGESPVASPGEPPIVTGNVYPTEGAVTCPSEGNPGEFNGLAYTGTVRQIEARDESTVVFHLCAPDAAFLPKVALATFVVNDGDWLEQAVNDGTLLDFMNGTGPYQMDEWRRGGSVIYSAFENYWGEAAAASSAVLRWSSNPAARVQELQAGAIHGIGNVGQTDFETVQNDPNLHLLERQGLNVFYVGFNNTHPPFDNEQVRQAIAMGIDRRRLLDTFYPPGSEVAQSFTPCTLPFGCAGEPWYEYDPDQARQLLADAGFPDGFDTTLQYIDVDRPYLPQPAIVVQELQAQLAELGIRAETDLQESGTFIANANQGLLDGIHLLGWNADYPEITNFLDSHFGGGASDQFGDKWDDVTSALREGATSSDEAVRQAAYEAANNAIRQHVPMIPVAHAGSATAYHAGVDGAQASPLSTEQLFRMVPADGDQIVFMQNAEPISLYCPDETDGESLRACSQSMEGLYAFDPNGAEPVPALAESCDPNEDNSVWTCTLREGVTFHNGATFEANDVLVSYAAQWDINHPLHQGNTGGFYYWGRLWGGNLNQPPPEQ